MSAQLTSPNSSNVGLNCVKVSVKATHHLSDKLCNDGLRSFACPLPAGDRPTRSPHRVPLFPRIWQQISPPPPRSLFLSLSFSIYIFINAAVCVSAQGLYITMITCAAAFFGGLNPAACLDVCRWAQSCCVCPVSVQDVRKQRSLTAPPWSII